MDELDKLRLKIAKAKGYRIGCTRNENGELSYDIIPDWPRDIAAAWELIEGFDNWSVYRSNEDGVDRYYCELTDNHRSYIWTSTTAPEAISRAWIAWKEAQ